MVSKRAVASQFVDLGRLAVLAVVYVAWLTVGSGVKKLREGFARLRTAASTRFAGDRTDHRSV